MKFYQCSKCKKYFLRCSMAKKKDIELNVIIGSITILYITDLCKRCFKRLVEIEKDNILEQHKKWSEKWSEV